MDMNNLINCMGTLFLLLAAGFICNKVKILTPENNRVLSRLVINVTLPAMTLDSIVNTEIDLTGELAKELLGAMAAYYVILFVLGFLFSRVTSRGRAERTLYHYMVMFGNTGFLGIPLITSMFGQRALFHVALFNIPFNLLAFTYGIMLIRGGKQGGGGFSWKKLVTPPTVASVLAVVLLLLGVKMPVPVANAVGYIGDMTVPGAMMIVGASLATVPGGAIWKEWRIYALSAFTLLIRPVVVMALVSLIITDPLVLGVTVILAAVPVASNTTALCIEYQSNETLASCSVFITTLLSMFTIPLVALVLL